ncbi:FHA domain-containing protein [Paraburkholderia acidisoli]|uniref:FHA domain-containing protein n=1 Tax=Paraburkholderia acidisoli TaxID=2571748 RepID=A0A7Z2JIV0_9BURK|nr:FHA domain-containing protein [Paraburkholderia acidisoli]QGZ64715.1 FHA domain-containing protein [Paraburkholderia acidisoli]
MVPDAASIAERQTTLDNTFDIVLRPLSHPELGEIRIEKDLFAVGRSQPPFASARPEIVVDVSRRHARIFREGRAAYVADLGSKNGTVVNGVEVTQKPHVLKEGDELSFGGALTFRVGFVARAARETARATVVTLTPERGDLGLQQIVVTGFPFLISKAEETFAQYREAFPHQVNYLSRRHAHIYVDGDAVYLEDLGSTNGTFVDEERLDDHAVRLEDGQRVSFGGEHFVYRVGIESATDATVTATRQTAQAAQADGAIAQHDADLAADADRTTFVGSAHSFLDIFCTPPAPAQDDEINPNTPQHAPDRAQGKGLKRHDRHDRYKRRKRGKLETFLSELSEALGGSGRVNVGRLGVWVGVIVVAAGALGAVTYFQGAPQREMQVLLANGRYESAARIADGYLAHHPGDAAWRAMGTEALLKAKVPDWIDAVDAHAFDRAQGLVEDLRASARHNTDAESLIDNIGWVGALQSFVQQRGGLQAPIRIYRDEAPIRALTSRWNDDPGEHQRALDRVAAYVPAFAAVYADTLSQLRKLQSDDSVYVAALDRIRQAIDTALQTDRFDDLGAMLTDYAQRYPRLAGLDAVRTDLDTYQAIVGEAHAGHAQAVRDRLAAAHFTTPQFAGYAAAHAAALETLASSGDHGNAAPR